MSFFDWGAAPEPPRALEELAAARQAELWDSSLSFLERGKAEDTAGKYRDAFILYSEGVDGLLALSEVSKREDVLSSYEAIVSQFQRRLQELRQILSKPTAIGDNSAPAPAAEVASPASAPAAAAAIAAPAKPGAAALAQARLCVELAVSADEAGDASAEETVKLYTAAVESYFEALKLEDDEAARAQHRTTVAHLLERAETLRGQKPGATPQPSTAPAQPQPPSQPSSSRPSGTATPLAAASPTPTKPTPAAAVSRASQLLGDDEKEVLARSSKIGGALYYPYMGDG